MAKLAAIGMIEMTSIGVGHQVQDTMLKASDVTLHLARTICSGKYIIIVGGDVGAVQAAVAAGLDDAPDGVIDHMMIPNVHKDVFAALGESVQLEVGEGRLPAIGIIETFSASSALEAADVAAKAAGVQLFRLHVAMAMGGKGVVMMAGTVADCKAAVDAGAENVREKGLLVSAVVIPGPSRELFGEHI